MAMIADLRKELEREAEEENIPILRRAERKLLLEAAAAADPKKILEVGTAIGYSALLLAEYFPLAEIDTIEIDALRNERLYPSCRRQDSSSVSGVIWGTREKCFLRSQGRMILFTLTGRKGSTSAI